MLLTATTRKELKKGIKKLREEGKIPAVVYGRGLENINLSFDKLSFEKIYSEVGKSTLFDLKVDNNEPIKVLVSQLQSHPIKNQILHVDLYQVNMKEKLTTKVKLNFISEAPAVKELSGILNKNLDEIDIQCLPGNLIDQIDVDLESLKTFEDAIHVRDLKISEGVEFLTDKDELVATVSAPKIEKEVEVVPTEEAVEGEDKKEGNGAQETEKKEENNEEKK